jgi:nucleotide-binding universal stress UspA family protein
MTQSALNAIVVGYDGSSAGERALKWAADEARQRNLRLHVIHVWPPPAMLPAGFSPPPMPDSEVILQDAVTRAAAVAPNIPITTQASPGEVAKALVDASVEADTVVVGAREHRRERVHDFGSSAWQVATHALCPVVVVRGTNGADRNTVVIGVDGSRGSDKALEYAFARAARAGLEIVAVYGWHLGALESYYHDDRRSGAELGALDKMQHAELTGWVAPFVARYPDLSVRTVAVRRKPAEALIEEGQEAHLIVVGSRGRGGFRGLLLGSVGMDLLRAAGCPVVIVRH